ncbi:MAG: thioredoxin [Clostridiales bacterium]|nr:thioredoxin [Clostridiales bacterium]
MEKIFTAENFEKEVLQSVKPVLVDFYADWCGPCKMMAPVVAEIAEKYADKVTVGKLNIDENMGIAQNYRVMSIPTLILYQGGEPVGRLVGLQDPEEVEAMLQATV